MASTPVEAAERLRTASARLAELRERLQRLEAGEHSTREDARRARVRAEAQHAATTTAQERLLRAQLSATARARRVTARLEQLRVRLDPSPALRRLSAENERLRRALVTLQTFGPDADGRLDARRRDLWQAVVDEARREDWRSWAHAVCLVAVELLPGVRGAALTLYDTTGEVYPLAASDEWTQRLEEIHLLLGEGPAITAHLTERPVRIADLSASAAYERWPGFVTAAGAEVRGLRSFPLPLDEGSAGSLTLYHAGRVPADGDGEAELLAAVAARAVVADLDAFADGDVEGLDAYADVDVAAGVLAVRLGVGVDEARDRIRAAAFSSGRGLVATAQDVLQGGLV